MSDSGELSDLVARVERLEQRMTMDAGLGASWDRDLSDLKVTVEAVKGTVQAAHLNQADHGVKLERLREGQDALRGLLLELIRRDDERDAR